MTTSEPTTGEIVRALRYCTDENSICGTECPAYLSEAGCRTTVIRNAIDRLESQEAQIKQLTEALAYANEWHKESVENATNELRELSGITGELERFRTFHERYAEQTSKKYIDDICALTARAEQAEKERDAAIEHVHDAIFGTNHSCFYCTMENCDGCTNSTVKEHFKYRMEKPSKYMTKIED